MKISVSDWSDLDNILPIALQYKTGIEILEFAGPDELDNGQSLAEETRHKISGFPLIGLHGPFSELIPASRDPLIRQDSRKRFEQAYQLAQMIGAQHLVLHSGYIPKTYPSEQWIQSSYTFWSDFLSDKNAPNMVHLENVYEDDFTALQQLVDCINQSLGDERISICLDIGHVNANSSKSLADWITGLGDRIRYTHLHNNGGILDDHWRLGQGNINIGEVLDLLSQHAPKAIWTIETSNEDIEPSLEWLQDRGYI